MLNRQKYKKDRRAGCLNTFNNRIVGSFTRMCRFTAIITAILWFIFPLPGNCFETESGQFKLSGFGTMGVVTSDDDELGFYRDISQNFGVYKGDFSFKTDSLFGMQLDAEITSKFDATLQLVLKDRPDDSVDECTEQFFLRYSIKPPVSVRIGRLPIDVYMLNDYRNVGFAYLWARPPVELYGRIPFLSFDGVDFMYSARHGTGTFHAKLFGGTASPRIPLGEVWKFDMKPVGGVSLTYQTNQWNIRGGLAYTKADTGIPPGEQLRQVLPTIPLAVWPEAETLTEDLDIKGDSVYYYSLGFSYDSSHWIFQSEFAYIESGMKFQPDEFDAYLCMGRRLGDFTPYLMVAMAKPDDSVNQVSDPLPVDPSLSQLQDAVYQVLNINRADQKKLSIGTKWDFSANANLKLQWDITRVKGDGAELWEFNNFDGSDKTINTFSLNLSFIF